MKLGACSDCASGRPTNSDQSAPMHQQHIAETDSHPKGLRRTLAGRDATNMHNIKIGSVFKDSPFLADEVADSNGICLYHKERGARSGGLHMMGDHL